MLSILHIAIFIVSLLALSFSSKWLVGSLIKISKYLGWKEFVVAFFTMALAATGPNLFLAISSIVHKTPVLSFADIVGGNIIDLTIAIGLAVLVSRKSLSLESRTVQGSAIFVLIVSLLPLILITDGDLDKTDGIVLMLTFFIYIAWMFRKKEMFVKTYGESKPTDFVQAIKNFTILLGSLGLLVLSAEGIVRSSRYFAELFNLPLAIIGIFIVSLGNCLPEIIFAIRAAKENDDWMVIGDLMGAIIIPSTFVLGLVAFFAPITQIDFSIFRSARIFLFIAAFVFFIFIKTGKKITKKEAAILFSIYILFILFEIIF
jgi:cation:H+ antiporter